MSKRRSATGRGTADFWRQTVLTIRELRRRKPLQLSPGTIQPAPKPREIGSSPGIWSHQTAEAVSPAQLREYHRRQDEAVLAAGPYPTDHHAGRGIVMVAGGTRYFTCAWVCLSLLRRVHDCALPIQVWYRGRAEMSGEMIELLDRFGVECIDLLEHGEGHSASQMRGWESKAYALLHSRFKEVILLDADVVPLRDPSDLFNLPRYQQTGAVFWPDINTLPPHAPIWDICRVPYRDEPEFESGQIVVDKEQTWEALHLALHLNELSSFYYKYLRGDKDTFHLAWRMLRLEYAMPPYWPGLLYGRRSSRDPFPLPILEQYDFEGRALFQHLAGRTKWTAWGENMKVPGLQHEVACREALAELRDEWTGWPVQLPAPEILPSSTGALNCPCRFLYCRLGSGRRVLEFLADGAIGVGTDLLERTWSVNRHGEDAVLTIAGEYGPTCTLRQDADGVWRGQWLRFEQMPVDLIPLSA